MKWNFSKKKQEDEELEEELDEIEEELDEEEELEEKQEKEETTKKDELKDLEEEIEDYEYELDDDEDDDKDLDAYINRRHQMFRFIGLVIGIIVFIGVMIFIFSLFSKRVYTYQELEKILKDAAVDYFEEFPESLPQEDGSIVEIDSSNLTAAKKMKDISDYKVKNNSVCTGNVQVQRVDGKYVYTPYLNCGDDYATQELYKKVVEDNDVTNSGYGLYGSNGNYVFRGENVNNYVQLDKYLWRIVKITQNNEIVLVTADGYSDSQPWDNRYNQVTNYNSGINNYETSRVKEYLQKVYNKNNAKKDDLLLSLKDKAKMVEFSVCIGKRDQNTESNDNSIECGQTLSNQKMGLLTLSDYIYASVDPNCKAASSKACRNYNYLNGVLDWWLITPNSENSHEAYKVTKNGSIVSEAGEMYHKIRPVIHLSNRVLFKSGNGTLDKPYKVK